MADTISTIPTSPKRKVIAVVTDFKDFPTYRNSLLVNQNAAHLFTAALVKSFTTSANKPKRQMPQEEITRDILNAMGAQISNLDERGVVKPGTKVKNGDILIGKIAEKDKRDLSTEEKMLWAIFGKGGGGDIRNTSVLYPFQDEGVVIGSEYTEGGRKIPETATVYVSVMKRIGVGDTLQSPSGVVGVVSSISPLEIKLSGDYRHEKLGVIVHPDSEFVPQIEELTEKYLWRYTLPKNRRVCKIIGARSRGGGTSPKYAGHLIRKAERRKEIRDLEFLCVCQIGHLTLERQTLLYEDKLSVRNTGRYYIVSRQPFLKAKSDYEQGVSVTEAELSALLDKHAIVAEMLRDKSDDPGRRSQAYEALVKNG